jgi:prepilin-type N-terminal cleavage/methylation domain-containing protein
MDTRGRTREEIARAVACGTRGFTLIELMVVITIIIVIVAIAIPNLMRSRMTSNEGAAISNMRTISSAEQQYQAAAITVDAGGMGTFASLVQLRATIPAFIDQALGSGTRQGYLYFVAPGGAVGAPTYVANADPIIMDGSGSRGFFVNESGIITFLTGGVAGPGDLPVQ